MAKGVKVKEEKLKPERKKSAPAKAAAAEKPAPPPAPAKAAEKPVSKQSGRLEGQSLEEWKADAAKRGNRVLHIGHSVIEVPA